MNKIALLTFAMMLSARAEPTRSPKPDAAHPQVRYDFDDDVVEGGIAQGDGVLVEGKRPIKHSTLIKIRETFTPELLKSAEDL
jgi:hypothetical protein